ncbi:MAG: response regulator [Deltaproteobacteria bacterium]|nr:response regulator [Deltaproteobacteria bacterium]
MDVLIVEDSETARTLLTMVAESRGHRVAAVDCAEAAVHLLKERKFPVVITDWELPAMNGVSLCRLVRALPGGEEPVILLATGRITPADIEAGLTAGADDYVPKPYAHDLLQTRFAVAERAAQQRREKITAERARKTSERRLAALADRSPVGIARVNPTTRAISEANAEFLRLVGAESVDSLGLDEIVAMGVFDARERLQRAFFAVGETKGEPFILRRPSGEMSHVLASVARFDEDGENALLIILHDVSEREQLRTQLMQADRMTSLGTLAAGVAHEINNPLAYTMNNIHFASGVLRALQPELEARGVTFSNLFSRFGVDDPIAASIDALEDAQQGSERIRKIVAQMRDFSRGDNERLELVSVREVVESALALVSNEVRHRARVELRLGEVEQVLANRGKLGQVVVNLLMNAAQAIEGNAADNSITVATRMIERNVEIEVSDTGIGIPPDVLSRIFDPFFTTKPIGVGTGLGLSICHGLISSFGGTIEATSRGRGATFRIRLPAADRNASPPIERHDAQASARRGRLLVVDDEPAIGRALQRLLGGSHEVTAVTDAREALELMNRGREFDVILCDIMMPQMNGMEFYSALVDRDADLDKLIFITGGAFTPTARRFLDNVQNDRLMKPLDMSALQRLIDRRLKDN